MFRSPVHTRDAVLDDADALVAVWSTPRPADREATLPLTAARDDAAASIARLAHDPDQRVLVAEIDDRVVGAVHLAQSPISPVSSEMAVVVMHLQVLEDFRRHGVGRALFESALTWAEERDTRTILAAASVTSRDANRFMARLGFGQVAVLRGASVASLRSKLPVEPPAAARVGPRTHRSVGQVLVARRSLRRSQTRTS